MLYAKDRMLLSSTISAELTEEQKAVLNVQARILLNVLGTTKGMVTVDLVDEVSFNNSLLVYGRLALMYCALLGVDDLDDNNKYLRDMKHVRKNWTTLMDRLTKAKLDR